jgi:SAM-dependent methyltransferase
MRLSAAEGYRLLSASYDSQPNALLSLETRVLSEMIEPLAGCRLLDIATGTGRWMRHAAARGAMVFGLDLCPEMLAKAEENVPQARGLVCASAGWLPFVRDAADIALCSFALGYAASPGDVLGEMARVARRVIVSDMHPLAVDAGWKRSFRTGNGAFEIEQCPHKVDEIDAAAHRAGLEKQWRIEAYFGPPERSLFEAAGKAHLYMQARRVPAVLATGWVRR